MYLTTEQMDDVAIALSKGDSPTALIDKYLPILRQSPDVDVSGFTDYQLRCKLSNEINRANPRSVQFSPTKYGAIHEEYQAVRASAFAEANEEMRANLHETIESTGEMLRECIHALMTAAAGERGKVAPATDAKDQAEYMLAATKLAEKLIGLYALGTQMTEGENQQIQHVQPALKI